MRTDGTVACWGNANLASMPPFRPSNGFWFVHGGAATQFGTTGDVPLALPDAIRRFFFPPL